MDFNERAYEALVAAVFQRFPSVQKAGFDGAYKPGLRHMQDFDAALGSPSKAFRSIHVAGTNGKGSVCSMLASVLAAAGYRTGLYTSPHISDFRERIRIGAELIPKEYAYEFLTRWEPYFSEHELSFFEITTGLCFKYFADSGVEIAVIETGLGGLLDSTNILTPVLSVVTNIGLDHTAYLGGTLPEIAAQKAGIFKDGVPALVGESGPETDPVFAEAAWMRCPLTFADKVKPSLWGRSKEMLEKMDLRAASQQKNLRTVLAALDILRETAHIRPDEETTVQALIHTAARTGFHGRWEKLSDVPYILCDIGHNAHALRYNFAQLQREVSSGRFTSLIVVYGIMADKDLDAILPLMPPDATYIFCAPDTPRALPAADILARYRAWCSSQGRSSGNAFEAPSVREAVRMATTRAHALTEAARPLIYIGGSTFVVSEAVNLFRR